MLNNSEYGLAVVCVAMSLISVACGGGQKEVKSPNEAEYDAGASTEDGVNGAAGADANAGPTDAGADVSEPPAPQAVPPSQQAPQIEVVVDGVTRPVQDNERLTIEGNRMLFFYSAAAATDCLNVQVSGLVMRSLAGLCQIGFLPLEQHVKPGQELHASITVNAAGGGSVTRTFHIAVLPEPQQ